MEEIWYYRWRSTDRRRSCRTNSENRMSINALKSRGRVNITFNIQRFSFVLLLCFEFVSFVWLNKYQYLTLNRSAVNSLVRLMTFIHLLFCWHCVWQICRSEVIYLLISVLTLKNYFTLCVLPLSIK